jgi:hypothetical protein
MICLPRLPGQQRIWTVAILPMHLLWLKRPIRTQPFAKLFRERLDRPSSLRKKPGTSVSHGMIVVGRTERSEFRLVLTRSKELPELAGARSGLRNEIPQFIADRALVPKPDRA